MPHTRSASKNLRKSEKRRMHNRSIKRDIKEQLKKFQEAAEGGNVEALKTEYRAAAKKLDKAAAKKRGSPEPGGPQEVAAGSGAERQERRAEPNRPASPAAAQHFAGSSGDGCPCSLPAAVAPGVPVPPRGDCRRPRHISSMKVGTRNGRTTKVSSSTPKASAKPICTSVFRPASISVAKVPAMMRPHAVMVPPVRDRPRRVPSSGPCRQRS